MVVEEFVIDEEDGFIPGDPDPVTARIGGVGYTAICPPDKKWHLFTGLQDGGDGAAEAMIDFLEAALSEEDAEEVMGRLLDQEDEEVSLSKLMFVFGKVLVHYEPAVERHFRAMGMELPTRPAAAKPVAGGGGGGGRRAGVKGARTPKDQTGARTGQ